MKYPSWDNIFALISSLLASSCCVVQLILNALSYSCAGFAVLTPYRSWFTTATLLLLGYSVFGKIRTPQARRQTITTAVVSTTLLLSPEIVASWNDGSLAELWGRVSNLGIIGMRAVEMGLDIPSDAEAARVDHEGRGCKVFDLSVTGMKCEGCAAKVKTTLLEHFPEASFVKVFFTEKRVDIGFPNSVPKAATRVDSGGGGVGDPDSLEISTWSPGSGEVFSGRFGRGFKGVKQPSMALLSHRNSRGGTRFDLHFKGIDRHGRHFSSNIKMFSTRWAVRFLVISLILALTIGIAAASDTTSSTAVVEATAAPHKCPLAEKCPWYEEHAREHTAAGCPVTEKCPYYKQHKGDKTVEDVVQEKEHHCPLSEKCPYYKQVKSGEAAKVVKVDSADCPIASKCPYYEKVKTNSEKLYDCPVMHGCPHYKQGDAHTNSGDASKCPHLAKKSAVPELAKQKAADAEDVLAAEAGKDEKSGCPLAEKCPWYEKAKSKDGKAAGCPVNENCPYYKQHKGDHTTDEVLSDSTKPCPLAEKCPYYKDAKNGKVDPAKVDSSGCPVASKCPYYETVKTDPSKQKDCPVAHACPKYKEGGKPAVHGDTSKCPHFAKRAAAQAEDAAAASEVKHACPLAEKCPWYEAHAKDHKAAGCPVTEKCPYYKQHKGDHTTDEALSDPNHHCPMANCPYYKDIKDGKPENVNWTAENCPIASNCPYYKTFKSSDAKHHDCPVLHACPKMKDSDKKFKKLAISGDKAKCPHFAKQADAKDEERADVIHKCPHLAAQKRSSAEADEKKHGCPLAEKCPWYETHAKEHGKAGCPVNEKCPYYKQHKADHNVEDVLTDKTHHCPLAEKCPFYKKVKDGKPDDTNYSATNCPIAEQCPYYKTYKSDDSKHHDCPVLHDCPHFHKRAATASSSDDEKPPKAQEADAPSTVGTKIKETRITDEL